MRLKHSSYSCLTYCAVFDHQDLLKLMLSNIYSKLVAAYMYIEMYMYTLQLLSYLNYLNSKQPPTDEASSCQMCAETFIFACRLLATPVSNTMDHRKIPSERVHGENIQRVRTINKHTFPIWVGYILIQLEAVLT